MFEKLSVIIPAYNEESHIAKVVDGVLQARDKILQETKLQDLEIVVVNDGSTDRTRDELKGFSQACVRVETHEVNMGYGAALKTGFKAASGNYLSFMDGDGTIDPLSFIEMYKALHQKNADMVVGKRLGTGESQMPVVRQIGNRFFATLLSLLSGTKVTDTASGVRIFKREILERLMPLPDGLHFTPAMSSKAVHEDVRIFEVPVSYADRSGESKLHVVKDGVRFLNIIIGTVLLYNPFKVFSAIGFLLNIAAIVLLWKPLTDVVTFAQFQFSDYIYRSIAALFMSVCGVQIILFGVLARFIVSTFFKFYEKGTILHQINSVVKIYDRMGIYGMFCLIIGGSITTLYYVTYLSIGDLRLHWSWLLIAAALMITGVQMVITGVVMYILKQIKLSLIK